jgi:hypothetical protein
VPRELMELGARRQETAIQRGKEIMAQEQVFLLEI